METAARQARKAIVFDLDGTLIDSAPDLRLALNRVLAARGRRDLGLDEVIGMLGDGAAKLVERAFAATGGLADGEVAALIGEFLDAYEGHGAELTRPYPGVRAVLARLREDGYGLAVCTNKPQRPSEEILAELGLDGFFSAVVGGDAVEGARKPDPRHLTAALRALGAAPRDAVMVGDNENDVAVARAAGVPVIAVAFGYAKVPADRLGADLVIDAFEELYDALGRLP